MSTYTKTICEERLKPEPTTMIKLSPKRSPRYSLIRTTSLHCIRWFPTFFCRQGSTEVIQWLSSSKSKLTEAAEDLTKQANLVLLTFSVYAAVSVLAIQLAGCFLTLLASQRIPLGLVFLISCVAGMAALAATIIHCAPVKKISHKNRSTLKRPKLD